MAELLAIWTEVGSSSRYAETKLAFFVGIVVTLLGVLNTGSPDSVGFTAVLRGGSPPVVNTAGAISLAFALLGIAPRLAHRQRPHKRMHAQVPENIYYFLAIAKFRTSEEWLTATHIQLSDSEQSRAAMLADQIHAIAKITARKYLYLRLAIWTLITGWVLSWVPSSEIRMLLLLILNTARQLHMW